MRAGEVAPGRRSLPVERRHGDTIIRVTPRSSHRCTSARDRDRAAEHDLEAVVGSRPCSASSARSVVDLRPRRTRTCDPCRASRRRGAPRAAARRFDSPPTRIGGHGLLHRLRFEHDLVEREELAVVRDRLLGPQPLADLDRFVDAAAARREVESAWRPTPARATTRRCRTRSGRPRGGRRSARRARVVNGWRSPMLNTCVPSRTRSVRRREEREVRERVVDRRVGRHRRMVLARMRRARHRAGEHEVLGQPHRLEAEPLGRERRVDVEVRVAARRARRRTSRRAVTGSPAVVTQPAVGCGPTRRPRGCRRRRGSSCR